MLELFQETAWLLLPLIGGGLAHGLAMKYGWTPWLAVPIDRGRTFRGVRWFGDNKTWRGPVYVGLGFGVVLALQSVISASGGMMSRVYALHTGAPAWFAIGFGLGAAAMLGELPNSFIKRRAGIVPGAGAEGQHAWFFYLYDQVDLLLPLVPLWGCLGAFTWQRLLISVALVTVIHQALSSIGFRLGMRKTPR